MAEQRYYIRVRGKILGPFDLAQLRRQRARGQLSRFHEVSEDRINWSPATSIAELFPPEDAPRTRPAVATAITDEPPIPIGPEAGRTGRTPPPASGWHYNRRGKEVGPVTRERLLELLDEGAVDSETLVWNPSLPDWLPLGEAPGLLDRAPVFPKKRSGPGRTLALLSFIAALAWLGGLGSVFAVAFGIQALLQMRQAGKRVRRRWMAVTGLIVGGIGLVVAPVAGYFIYYAIWPKLLTPDEVSQRYKNKVYIIEVPESDGVSKGSGILLANDESRGLIATNLHVISLDLARLKDRKSWVKDLRKDLVVEVKNPSQLHTQKATIAAFHRELDLALLLIEMDHAHPDAVSVVRQSALREGEGAVAMGYPLGIQLSTTNGIISNTRGEAGRVYTNCAISSGNSGGPLFVQRKGLLAGLNTSSFTGGPVELAEENGRIVGKKGADTQNFNGAVPAEEIVAPLQNGQDGNWIWAQEHKRTVIDLVKRVPVED